jgi:hypothetical protein
MMPTTAISLDEVNRCIRLFADCQKAFMHSEKRAGLRSILFDVPRRSSIGWHCIYRHGYKYLRLLSGYAAPEEIGRRMKRLCSRPYYLTLSIVMCSYLGARQQMILDRGLSAGDPFPGDNIDELFYVVDWWKRACQSYRNDGLLLPEQAGDIQPILPAQRSEELSRNLNPVAPDTVQQLRRTAATLELYSFILHGEQRDGIFGHGPYPVRDGRQLVVLEFTDLQNQFLPWAQTAARNPYPNLALALLLKDARASFHLFGSMLIDPPDFAPCVDAAGLFTRTEDGEVHVVPQTMLKEIQLAAADGQNELYIKAADWSPRYKAEYGIHLFANHLRSFLHLVGVGSRFDEEIRSDFQAAAAEVLDKMLTQPEVPSMWPFMATTREAIFWPAAPEKKVLVSNALSKR